MKREENFGGGRERGEGEKGREGEGEYFFYLFENGREIF